MATFWTCSCNTFEIQEHSCDKLLGAVLKMLSWENKGCRCWHEVKPPTSILWCSFLLMADLSLYFVFAAFSLTQHLDEESHMSLAEHLTTFCDDKFLWDLVNLSWHVVLFWGPSGCIFGDASQGNLLLWWQFFLKKSISLSFRLC